MAYDYGAKEPEKLKIKDMTPRQKELLIDSDNFCMLPWMHLHAYPAVSYTHLTLPTKRIV